MAIVAGVNIPDNKRVEVALTRIYGIGPNKSLKIVKEAGISGNPRIKDLTEAELNSIPARLSMTQLSPRLSFCFVCFF